MSQPGLSLRRRACCRLLLLLMPLFGSGCGGIGEYVHKGFKVGPQYQAPPAPVETDWIDAADKRIRADSPDLRQWWSVFNDPVLDSLVADAYQQNISLREAGFRILEARAQRAIAVGTLFPQQQALTGSSSRTVVRAGTNPLLTNGTFSSLTAGFNLAWELDFWGRFRRAIEAADADLNASIEDYDDVLVTLLGDVANTYVEIRTIQQQIAFSEANAALQQQTLTFAAARFRGGTSSDLDVEQARSNLEQTQALIPQQRIELRKAENRLCVLLGMPPGFLETRLGQAPIPVAPPQVALGVPAELLARRPDIRRAERQVAAQTARIGVAASDLYPHVSVTGSLSYFTVNPNNLFDHLFLGSMGPAFQWNVLNYGRLLNNVRLQDARTQELIATYQNTVLRAAQEAENGVIEFLQSQQRALHLRNSVNASDKAVQLSLVQYRAGLVDFNRVALLEQNLVQQQNIEAQARGDIAIGLIDIYRALGGGWQIRLGPPPQSTVAPQPPAQQPEPIVPPIQPAPKA
jgi:NodT family efflux transporter outer membrane factor (OMF) lipoprotein